MTGVSTGLGRAFAEMLLREEVEVWGTSRAAGRLAIFEANPRFHPVELDLRDGAAAERIFLESAKQADGFDLVINNAGYGVFGGFAATDFAIWQEQIEVMLVNTARLSHAALRVMHPRGTPAALVNISSLAVEFPLPFQSAYNIAKAGLTALNESLMVETAGTPVIVLDVRPGDFRTDFESSVSRPAQSETPAMKRAWGAFTRMMAGGPAPDQAAAALGRALRRRRSGTVRCGRFSQAVVAPFMARFGSLDLKRRIQARYFNL